MAATDSPGADAPLHGRVCVVTGATSGIGRETAVQLAARGANVLLVGRDAERGKAALAAIRARGKGEAAFLPADLSSQENVRRLADEIRARCPRLDVLVNNAGGANAKRQLMADGIEKTFAINHLAPFLFTNLLRDLLVASKARVVTVSSDAHRSVRTLDFDNLQGEKRYKPIQAYSISKLANVLFTYELARQFQGTGATATCLHPGVVRTGIWQGASGVWGLIVTLAKPFMISSETSARSVVRLAADPVLATTSGRYFKREKEVRSSELSYDQGVAAKLWKASEALIR